VIRKAFTLIELLVVIAIIAILAAILFPVFAQAKEAAKKSASLSNVKQTALGIILYTSDYDDNYPSAYSLSQADSSGTDNWAGTKISGQALTFVGVVPTGFFWVTTVPAGADDPAGVPDDSLEWANSTQAYRKSYGVTTNPGAPQLDVYGGAVPYKGKPDVTSYCMNGLLSVYSATAVVQPSRSPLVWPGEQKNNYSGGNWSNPMMKCDNTTVNPAPPCRFGGSSAPQSGSALAGGATADGNIRNSVANNYSWWLYSQGFNYAATDSSAHFTRVANGGSYSQPFFTVLSDGQVGSPIRCTSAATVAGGLHYAAWFRPDSNFNYGLTNTAATQEVCNN
jgi:prepilin-type N-terminal cleavage/methylation domain-containing protein